MGEGQWGRRVSRSLSDTGPEPQCARRSPQVPEPSSCWPALPWEPDAVPSFQEQSRSPVGVAQTLGCSPRMRVQPGTEAMSGRGCQPGRAWEESCRAEPDAAGKRPFGRLLPSLTLLALQPRGRGPAAPPRGPSRQSAPESGGAGQDRPPPKPAGVPRECSWTEVSGHSPAAWLQDIMPWFCGGHPNLEVYGMTSGFLKA